MKKEKTPQNTQTPELLALKIDESGRILNVPIYSREPYHHNRMSKLILAEEGGIIEKQARKSKAKSAYYIKEKWIVEGDPILFAAGPRNKPQKWYGIIRQMDRYQMIVERANNEMMALVKAENYVNEALSAPFIPPAKPAAKAEPKPAAKAPAAKTKAPAAKAEPQATPDKTKRRRRKKADPKPTQEPASQPAPPPVKTAGPLFKNYDYDKEREALRQRINATLEVGDIPPAVQEADIDHLVAEMKIRGFVVRRKNPYPKDLQSFFNQLSFTFMQAATA